SGSSALLGLLVGVELDGEMRLVGLLPYYRTIGSQSPALWVIDMCMRLLRVGVYQDSLLTRMRVDVRSPAIGRIGSFGNQSGLLREVVDLLRSLADDVARIDDDWFLRLCSHVTGQDCGCFGCHDRHAGGGGERHHLADGRRRADRNEGYDDRQPTVRIDRIDRFIRGIGVEIAVDVLLE